MKTKLVIFDMDGTILDTLQDLADAINRALKVKGYPVHTLDEVKSYVGNGIRRLVERAVPCGLTRDEIDAVHDEFLDYYQNNCANNTKPYAGIIELLRALRARGVHVAVNSNKNDAEVKLLADKYFGGLVEYSVGTRDNVPKKPAPDGVIDIMEHFGVSREEAVYVGDSDVDIQTAVNSNVDAVIVDWGFREREALLMCIDGVREAVKSYGKKISIVATCNELLQTIE